METITGEKITTTCGSCNLAVVGDIDPQDVGKERPIFCYAEPPRVNTVATAQGLMVDIRQPTVHRDMPACGKYQGSRDALTAFNKTKAI